MQQNPKCQILRDLGHIDPFTHWPNYLEYGFTPADLPDLIAMLREAVINDLDDESDPDWAPLHAWRTIGQLGCAEAVEPLLDALDHLAEDDLAPDELSLVFGMIGEAAIDPLIRQLHDPTMELLPRLIIIDGLKEIAQRHPSTRDRVVSLLTDYLQTPDAEAPVVNAAVVSMLIRLSATESMDVIRDLYAKDLADLSFCGDIEDVEIEMGLRQERDTPRPDYLAAMALGIADSPDSTNPLDIVDFYLDKYATEDSLLNAAELNGFLTSIACAPEIIPPSAWFAGIWGQDQMPIERANQQEASEFLT
ncbi:MAG: UPF0149 family protein, partial [Gammaproteobacteria bacterium]|nr:UPF0149 family protein [Gammaproteobacteria bacterium]